MNHHEIVLHLHATADEQIALSSQRFFKTGEEGYGYGDKFLGIRVPELRKFVKQVKTISLEDITLLLMSEYHEIRLFALLLMVERFSKGDEGERESIYGLYIRHTNYINSWDLVDSSAPYIMGAWLFDKARTKLYEFATSSVLWERRISIVATAYFIKNKQFYDTFKIATILLTDEQDLIHKAVGWMLREVGKRDREAEEKYLKKNYTAMPRTMLRYAIEKFEPECRQAYLKGKI